MEILQAFGINSTAFIQFFIFLTTFTFLVVYVFGPYVQSVTDRESKTKGSEEAALEIKNKSLELHASYQDKAKEVHGKINEIYSATKSNTAKDYESILAKAKDEALKLLEENRLKIFKSIEVASAQLKEESMSIAILVSKKLIGK